MSGMDWKLWRARLGRTVGKVGALGWRLYGLLRVFGDVEGLFFVGGL